MAIQTASLFFKNNRNYGIGNIDFDLILSESHNFNNTVTQFNIEDGSNISDHIRNELFNGTVTMLITNFSLLQDGIISNRAQDAYDALESLWRERDLVTIVTVLKVFDNVAITNISINRGTDSGEALEVDVSFQEINIVKLQELQITASIKLKNMNSTQNKQSANKLNKGKQQGVQ